jgi:hypothetical protein
VVAFRRRVELRGGGSARGGWRTGGIEAEVVEDALRYLRVGDEGDEAEATLTLPAREDVDGERGDRWIRLQLRSSN